MDNVIVTGGSRGLGLAISTTLATTGYRVVAIARRATAELDAAVKEVGSPQQGALHFHSFDLTDIAGLSGLVLQLRERFGPIYGLVNNAGMGKVGMLSMMRDGDIERLALLNMVAPMVLTKYAVRSMMVKGAGRIVNITSIVGSNGYSGLSVYAASKASLAGFTRSLAREVGRAGITVNAVAPGFVATDMTLEMNQEQRDQIIRRTALRRLVDSQDVAMAVEFLLSAKARNITGTTLTVDAGNTA